MNPKSKAKKDMSCDKAEALNRVAILEKLIWSLGHPESKDSIYTQFSNSRKLGLFSDECEASLKETYILLTYWVLNYKKSVNTELNKKKNIKRKKTQRKFDFEDNVVMDVEPKENLFSKRFSRIELD